MDAFVYSFLGPEDGDCLIKWGSDILPKKLVRELIRTKFRNLSKLKTFLQEYSIRNKIQIEKTKKLIINLWKEKSPDIISELETLFKTTIDCKTITIYLTTFPMFPYNQDECWFTSSVYSRKADHLETMKHELNHFYFHKVFGEKDSRINGKDFWAIKESFCAITLSEEEVYDSHKNLRNFIRNVSNKAKGGREIYEQCIDFVNR